MHSLYNRTVAIFSFLTPCISYALLAIAISSFFSQRGSPELNVAINGLSVRKGFEDNHSKKQTDKLEIKFDLSADFERFFDWNVKQVFMYCVLEYEMPQRRKNDIVLFDKIIFNGRDRKKVQLTNVKNKYVISDLKTIKEIKNAKLRVDWHVTPYVGLLSKYHGPSVPVEIIEESSPKE